MWSDQCRWVSIPSESASRTCGSYACLSACGDPHFEEATEGEELDHKEKLKTKWEALEAVVGAEKRIGLVDEDFVKHWDARLEVMDGKAMIGLHKPAHLLRTFRGHPQIAPRLASQGRRHGRDEDRDDRLGVRSIGVAGSRSQQAPARGADQAVQESARHFEDRARGGPTSGLAIAHLLSADIWAAPRLQRGPGPGGRSGDEGRRLRSHHQRPLDRGTATVQVLGASNAIRGAVASEGFGTNKTCVAPSRAKS